MSGTNVNQDALGKLADACDEVQAQCYEKSSQFLSEIQGVYNKIARRFREIGNMLSRAKEELENAKIKVYAARMAVLAESCVPYYPGKPTVMWGLRATLAYCEGEKIKCEKRVRLFGEAFNAYQTQGRRLREDLDTAHFQLKSLLSKYAENNSTLYRRLNLASRDLEEYFLPVPCVDSIDFVSPREQTSVHSGHLGDQYKKLLEKENFCIDESVKEKYGIEYSQYNIPIFPSLFDFTIAEENLRKDPNFHYTEGIKKLQKLLAEDQVLYSRFSFDQIEQINNGMTPRGYVWYHDPNPPLGRLQLVNEEILLAVKTPKGYDLWQKVLKKN